MNEQTEISKLFSRTWWQTATIESVKQEIANGADVNTKDKYGKTGFNAACLYGADTEIIKFLIKSGTTIDLRKDFGSAVLFSCLSNKNLKTLDVLVNLGADVNTRNADGGTLFMTACSLKSKLELLNKMISLGADINAKDNYGCTPLIYACKKPDNAETIKALVALGADINACDNEGKTVYEYAEQYGQSSEILQFLGGKNRVA